MRRALVTTLAVPALLLAGCSGEDPADSPVVVEQDPAPATSEEPTGDGAGETSGPGQTSGPGEAGDGAATQTAGGDGPEGGEEGEAVAARAEAFLGAFVRGEPEACDYMVNIEGTAPMVRSESDLEVCREDLVGEVTEGFGEEMVGVIESMEIRGADVQGDTATIDADNFSDLFAQGMGDYRLVLKRFDDEWYVDIADSFTQR